MVFFYKATHNLVHLSPSVVPIVRGSARTTRTSATVFLIFVPKSCRTTTYQKSFFIRTTRIWNLLIGRMDLANATLTSFKSLLYDYYSRAVRTNLACEYSRFSFAPATTCEVARANENLIIWVDPNWY